MSLSFARRAGVASVAAVAVVSLASVAPSPPSPPAPSLSSAGSTTAVAAATTRGVAAGDGLAVIAAAVAKGSYSFLAVDGGKPVRWDPCAPIRYRVNLNGAVPSSELTRVKAGFTATGRALGGVRFVYAGTTTVVPDRGDEAVEARTDVVFAFAEPGSGARRSSMLGGTAGLGGFSWSSGSVGGDGLAAARATSGFVVIDARQVRRMDRRTRTSLYLHELGHVAGLGHTNDRRQVMYPTLRTLPQRFVAGDLAGLKRLGRSAGCIQLPGTPAAPAFTVSGGELVISVPPVRSVSGRVTYVLNSNVFEADGAESGAPTFRVPLAALATTWSGSGVFWVSAKNSAGQVSGPQAEYPVEPVPEPQP